MPSVLYIYPKSQQKYIHFTTVNLMCKKMYLRWRCIEMRHFTFSGSWLEEKIINWHIRLPKGWIRLHWRDYNVYCVPENFHIKCVILNLPGKSIWIGLSTEFLLCLSSNRTLPNGSAILPVNLLSLTVADPMLRIAGFFEEPLWKKQHYYIM